MVRPRPADVLARLIMLETTMLDLIEMIVGEVPEDSGEFDPEQVRGPGGEHASLAQVDQQRMRYQKLRRLAEIRGTLRQPLPPGG